MGHALTDLVCCTIRTVLFLHVLLQDIAGDVDALDGRIIGQGFVDEQTLPNSQSRWPLSLPACQPAGQPV